MNKRRGHSDRSVTAERVRELLDYDLKSGQLTWRATGRGRRADRIAGEIDRKGYRLVTIDYVRHYAHHLAWLHVHGQWPKDIVDHIDLDTSNNAIANLREASKAENCQNAKRRRDNTTGFKGVSFHKQRGKFRATIQVDGKSRHLGLFAAPETAHAAYIAAAEQSFGQFARAA